jgi:hypothetical protein
LREIGNNAWKGTKIGVVTTAAALPPTALLILAVSIYGPVEGLALTTPAFHLMAQFLKNLKSSNGRPAKSKKRAKRQSQ